MHFRHAFSLLLATPVVAQDTGVQFVTGTDAFLELAYDPQFIPQSGLTIEAWVTYDDTTIPTGLNYFPTIARQHVSGGGNEAWFLRVNAGSTGVTQLRFRASTTGGNVIVNWSFSSGQLTSWTHVAATFDAAAATIYVNGAPVASTPGNGLPLRDLGGELRVGKGATLAGGPNNEVWNGEIDELRVWPFARTQAEIQTTMMQKLQSVPGRVATWNFDNSLVDSSTGHALVQAGSANVNFLGNTLMLTTPNMGTAVGTSTPGCLGDLVVCPTSAPTLGNGAYGAACVQLTPSAFAFWGVAFGVLVSPLPVAGINVWIDPTGAVSLFTNGDGFGVLRLGLPIPSSTSFLGQSVAMQAAPIDPCGPSGLTASNAMTFTIQ